MNRGFSGYNSKHCLIVMEKAVIADNPDMVIVCIGANDALDSSLIRQFVSLDQYIHNLKQIVLELRSVGICNWNKLFLEMFVCMCGIYMCAISMYSCI